MVRLIDAHMHLWSLSRQYYGWLQDDPLPNNPAGDMSLIAGRDYLVGDYLSDLAGVEVEACVHVECGLPLKDQLAETRWLETLADVTRLPTAIVAGARLEHPAAGIELAAQAARPRVRGVRQILNWHADPLKTYTPRDLLRDEAWLNGFGRLARHELSFDLQIYPSQMQSAAELAGRHPETTIILNHAGMPTDRDPAGLKTWRDGLAALARHQNVSAKISGLAMVDRSWTPDSLRPFIRTVIDTFGPERCLFGSNFPVEKVHGDFARHLEAFMDAISVFAAADQALVLEGTARRIYRLAA